MIGGGGASEERGEPHATRSCQEGSLVRRTWSEDELREQWSLSSEEQALLTRKTPRGQLGFVVLLKYFQLE